MKNERPTWCHLLFYFASYVLNMFRTVKPAAPNLPTHNELRYVQSQIHITKYINNALITKQPMKHTTHKRTKWSQSITDSDQYQLKYAYQLQQKDKKTSHQTHTIIQNKFTLTLNHPSLQNKMTDVVIQQHRRNGYINVRNILST